MADAHKYQAHEVLNRVLNAGEDGLNVDLADSVTVTVDSEFPAASAISDNFANPTTTSAMSMLMGYDGSAWDRVTIGGGTEAAALRVTIANDSTGVVSVDDGGGALTVDGTVTANLSATDNAVLDAIDAVLDTIKVDTEEIEGAVETIEGAVSGSEMQVDVVAISAQSDGTYIGDIKFGESLPAGSAAIGKLAANSGVDIGDVDVTSLPASTNTIEVVGDAAENAAAAGNPVLTGGRYDSPGNDNATVRALGDNDVGALALDPTGALYVREYLGQTGSCFVSGTAAVTAAIGKFVAIQFLEDTVFNGTDGLVATDSGRWPDDTDAATDISSSNTAAVGSQTFPQGMTIFGRWDSFILVSGAVIAYVGNV